MRKKLNRMTLRQLAKEMHVVAEDVQWLFNGDVKGTREDPFTYSEMILNIDNDSWSGGWVTGVEKNGYLLTERTDQAAAYISDNILKVNGESTMYYDGGTLDNLKFYDYDDYNASLNDGTWDGVFVQGIGYVAGLKSYSNGSFQSYLDIAKLYVGVSYVWGGTSSSGMDCSGLVTLATGSTTRWTTSSGKPPGNWVEISPGSENLESFKNSLSIGDLLVWEGKHVAFYNGGLSLFHAHGDNSKGEVGPTYDLKWWFDHRGCPTVYRQTK